MWSLEQFTNIIKRNKIKQTNDEESAYYKNYYLFNAKMIDTA